MQLQNHNTIILNCIGASLVLPIFFVINGSSISLADSYYKVEGIALPIGIIVLFLFRKRHFELSELIILLIVAMYVCIGYLEGQQRHLLTIQFLYFFVVLSIFKSLTTVELTQINRGLIFGLMTLLIAHTTSIILFSDGDYLGQIANIFGLTVYQALLTYPLVLSFGVAILCQYENISWKIKYIFVLLATFIIFLTLRRVGLTIYLFTLLLFIPWHGKMIVFLIAIMFGFFILDWSSLSGNVARLFDIFQGGGLQRANTWMEKVDMLNQSKIMLFGNGLNNYAHNLFLQQLSTHGFLIGTTLNIFALYIIFSGLINQRYASKKFFYLLVLVLLDFNLNSNLMQFYYAGVFAFFLAGARREVCIERKL